MNGDKRERGLRRLLSFCLLAVLSVSCSSIDCPLNNLVYTNYALYNSDGGTDTMKDTLTVTVKQTDGMDAVVLNKDVDMSSFALPISYSQAEDVFYLELRDKDNNTTLDTITVAKEDKPHFESIDCAPSFFHTITGVRCTHNAIDSVVINTPDVNYDTSKEHFHIYFKHRN